MTDTNIKPFPRSIRLHGKSPRIDHIEPSYPILVRDGILTRIQAMPFFAGFSFTTNKSLQIQPTTIPFCGVYLLQEMMSADGEANAGEVRFRTLARVGISIIIQNNDATAAEHKLDMLIQHIVTGLFSDPTFYNNDRFKIQGFTGGSRMHAFGSLGLDNETPIAELRFELTCDLGIIYYPPFVPDDLEVIHVKTAYPSIAKKDTSQQIEAEYDVDQNE